MSRTPETIKNKKAEAVRNLLLGVGLFFALVGVGALNNGDNPIWVWLISLASFILAFRIKVIWKKVKETSSYK